MKSSRETYERPEPSRDSVDDESDLQTYDDSEGLISRDKKSSKASFGSFHAFKLTIPLFVICFVVVIVVESVLLIRIGGKRNDALLSPNGLSMERKQDRTIYQHSKYISHNETEAALAWAAILPGHGVVAIDPQYAAQKNLPDSVELPDGSGNRVYVLEAYHAIHCLVGLRSHYLALEQGKPWNWSRPHDLHCFDALRQYVMCNIDDTLLHTTGHRDAGHDQRKKCHDWDAMRDWAEARSARYFDVEPGMGIPHMNNYHAGDGLPVGSLS